MICFATKRFNKMKLRKLRSLYNVYYHKDIKVWGIGKKDNNDEYFATISSDIIQFHHKEQNKEIINSFLSDLYNLNMLTIKEVSR